MDSSTRSLRSLGRNDKNLWARGVGWVGGSSIWEGGWVKSQTSDFKPQDPKTGWAGKP